MVGKVVIIGLLVLSILRPGQLAGGFRLDAEGGVGGLAFGTPAEQLPDFARQFRKQGKPRLSTQLYGRPQDTTQLAGLGPPTSYYFRQSKFIGVDKLPLRQPVEDALAQLTRRYGEAHFDAQAKQWYWLGQHSFILLEKLSGQSSSLIMGSLAMLNELVEENEVRAQARQQLKWQPDSIGLPRQLHLRH